MIKLNNYLRQYRHNDNSDFVLGYEQKGTEVFFSCLEQEIAELKQLAETKNARTLGRIGRIEQQEREIESLKNQVSQLKSEHESMAAYADQRINMLTRANKKLGGKS